MIKISPARDDFINLAQNSNLIAVSAVIDTDLDTPVSIFYKIVGNERRGFILESVDTTQQAFGRFSFVGAEPFVELQVFKSKLMIRDGDLMKCIDGNPVDAIKTFMSRYKPANLDKNLPLANGGMVGYFNFEIAATFDRIRGLELGVEVGQRARGGGGGRDRQRCAYHRERHAESDAEGNHHHRGERQQEL